MTTLDKIKYLELVVIEALTCVRELEEKAITSAAGRNKSTGLKKTVLGIMENQVGKVNIYQMADALNNQFSIKSIGDAMRGLAKDGLLKKTSLMTYERLDIGQLTKHSKKELSSIGG